jgi:hypothetical protein
MEQVKSSDYLEDYTVGTGCPFPGAKARPGCDADHWPPSSAKVENEELYILSPKHICGV